MHQMFSTTSFSSAEPVGAGVFGNASAHIQASSQTLGKWDLWTKLQSCSVIECCAVAVLSKLYNNDCEGIDVTPYTFATDRVVSVLAWSVPFRIAVH